MGKKKSINDMMEHSRLVIFNAHDDETIRTRFEPFGYDEKRHLANKAMYKGVSDLILQNESEHAEWRKASEAFNATKSSARKKLTKITQSLKFWYDANSPEAIDLGLYTNKISKYADFKTTATKFYTVLLKMESVLTKLVPFGYTKESIEADYNEILSLDELRDKREQESGDAQSTIKVRNAKLDELEECVSEMLRLARLIFRDEEDQYLEKFGIVVK